MNPALSSLKRLIRLCLDGLHTRFVRWTRPPKTLLLLGTIADLGRSKPELIAENALLRQQLIILKRQVKRPACTKADRLLLVLLAVGTVWAFVSSGDRSQSRSQHKRRCQPKPWP